MRGLDTRVLLANCPEGFLKGFTDSMRLSLEADVMRALIGERAPSQEKVIKALRHFVDDHMMVKALAHAIS